MRIGVPTEIKSNEYRVGLTPGSVRELHARGHAIVVQRGAGAGIRAQDELYRQAGATLVDTAAEVYAGADMIVKVKEPQPSELGMLEARHTLFTYLHLAAEVKLAQELARIGCTAIAYETVTAADGSLPLLAPMSEVAGRLSIQIGARCLEREMGGAGLLLSGVPGVAAADVLVIGGGVVGTSAVQLAMGIQARVTVLDKSLARLRALEAQFGGQLTTVYATHETVEHYVKRADLVIGAVLVPGAATPKLVTREMLPTMKPGSVIVDVAIDQGGCVETSRPTTYADPTYVIDGVVHYCVTNMPGSVPRTSTYALNNATLPFVLQIAEHGTPAALARDPHLRNGLNVFAGQITHPGVAAAVGTPCVAVDFSRAA